MRWRERNKGRKKETVKRVQPWKVSLDRSPAHTRACIPPLGTALVLQVGVLTPSLKGSLG